MSKYELSRIGCTFDSKSAFSIEWYETKLGHGITSFVQDISLICDSDYMSEDFVRKLMAKFIQGISKDRWPILLQEYGSLNIFLDTMSWKLNIYI